MSFEEAFEHTVGFEGGYVNDPADPGGETKFGISKRSYPNLNIAALTLEDAREIYRRDFWNRLRLDEVQDQAVAAEIFDTAVNMGRGQAVRIAQSALEFLGGTITVDGVIGPQTIGAINRWCVREAEALHKALNGEQYRVYRAIVKRRPESLRFARGWMKRIQEYKELSA